MVNLLEEERLREENTALSIHRTGCSLTTFGGVLLWMDVFWGLLIYIAFGSTSPRWLWWLSMEAAVGALLWLIGRQRRTRGVQRLRDFIAASVSGRAIRKPGRKPFAKNFAADRSYEGYR